MTLLLLEILLLGCVFGVWLRVGMGWLALGDAVLCDGLLAPFMPGEGVDLLVGRGLRGGLE